MTNDDSIISGFDSKCEHIPFAIDLSLATPLDRAGSTCDAYECTVQRRRVFVKRLKAEYRDNPLYRAAFEKEYELGVTLSHPSLPRYVGLGGDYIVMDYVEGDTLADLIKRGDPRLKSRKFVRRLLLELVDVVDYLHRRNIVHCDIKADNVIISPYDDRPATLIDLDKAYASWLGSTHGNTQKYGCDTCADGAIDFRGLGKIAEMLGRSDIARLCLKDGASAESIRRALKTGGKHKLLLLLVSLLTIALSLTLWFANHHQATPDEPNESALPPATATPDTVLPIASAETKPIPTPLTPTPTPPPTIDQRWIADLITQKASDIEGYRSQLWAILDCDSIPLSAKYDAIYDYTVAFGQAYTSIIHSAVTHFSEFSELDVQYAVRQHPAWIRLEKGEEETQAKLNEWRTK